MEYRLLGPIEVLDGERRLPLGGPKQRALLAVLLLGANRVVPRGELVEAVWPEGPPPTAATAVQVYVSRLRKTLPEGVLETRPAGYILHVDPGQLDLERFERLANEARLREALALWRGSPVEGIELGVWARAEVHRLAELHAAVLEDRIEADLALGRDAELIGELEGLVARHPLRERLRGQLMLALYRAGRQAEALEQYRVARSVLLDELGLEPDAALRRLHGAILRQEPGLELQAAATERVRAAVLFAILTPGDEGEPAAVRELLEQAVETASSELREAGAAVERGLAGALLARFGGDAGDALSAATAVQRRLDSTFAGSVRARIGIEAGEVLAGPGGITGTPVAVAAKLAGAAAPGEVLVGEAAAAAIGDPS
ncbi:MAG: BTAD domain-containing putative transcriptional regulator [Gaiellaceae bacterium]